MSLDILDVSRNSRLIEDYELILSFFGIFISNSEAKRETASVSTCIDHIISKYDMSVTTLKTSLGDHYALVASIGSFLDDSDNSKIGRNLKLLNKNENILKFLFVLHQNLNNCNLETIDDILTDLRKKLCLDVFDRFRPQQTLLRKKHKDWMTNDIIRMCKKRDRLHAKTVKKPSLENINCFRMFRNKVKMAIMRAQRDYHDKKIAKMYIIKTNVSSF